MPHKPLITDDREMKRFVTASESKAVTAEGISNTIVLYGLPVNIGSFQNAFGATTNTFVIYGSFVEK